MLALGRCRFAEQRRQAEGSDDEFVSPDDDFVRALEYGLPPTAGEQQAAAAGSSSMQQQQAAAAGSSSRQQQQADESSYCVASTLALVQQAWNSVCHLARAAIVIAMAAAAAALALR